MSLQSALSALSGTWQGSSRLHLSWLEDESARIQVSDSTLTVRTMGRFGVLHYTWAHDGEPQEGLITVLGLAETPNIQGGLADTFHSSESTMAFSGSVEGGTIRLLGSYGAGEGPDWGWRIEISPSKSDGASLRMFNITPDGEEEWAVDGQYQRVPEPS